MTSSIWACMDVMLLLPDRETMANSARKPAVSVMGAPP
jgi:hypothetical protein